MGWRREGGGVSEKQSLGSLVSGLTDDLSTLVRGEIELAKTELRNSARSAASGTGLILGALIVGSTALLFILLTLAWVLVAIGLPIWAGFGIVTLVLVVLTVALGVVGLRRLKSIKGPERAAASLAKTKAAFSRTSPDAG
ncbi:MAG: phage holin family protein [Actinobacteria bacterium]|nr:phage holin family protein [Actinomycetota bacterium]MSW37956.1 phage holin family protein [Actinomycetota bacterium]